MRAYAYLTAALAALDRAACGATIPSGATSRAG